MWFGAPGGCVKRYDVQNKTWAVYYLNGVNFDTIRQLSSEEASKPGFWEKCDAIAQDSSGVLWFANWGNKTNNIKGSLICTDPSIKSL